MKKISERSKDQAKSARNRALIKEIGPVAVAKNSSICYQTAGSFVQGKPIRAGIETELVNGGVRAVLIKLEQIEKDKKRLQELLNELHEWKAEKSLL
jgi:hypothetical protein